jgi:hypothetical protein
MVDQLAFSAPGGEWGKEKRKKFMLNSFRLSVLWNLGSCIRRGNWNMKKDAKFIAYSVHPPLREMRYLSALEVVCGTGVIG